MPPPAPVLPARLRLTVTLVSVTLAACDPPEGTPFRIPPPKPAVDPPPARLPVTVSLTILSVANGPVDDSSAFAIPPPKPGPELGITWLLEIVDVRRDIVPPALMM